MSGNATALSAIFLAALVSASLPGSTPVAADEFYETAQLNLRELDRVRYREALYDAYCDAVAYYGGNYGGGYADGNYPDGYYADAGYGNDGDASVYDGGDASVYDGDDDGYVGDAYPNAGYAGDADYSDGVYLGDDETGATYAEDVYGDWDGAGGDDGDGDAAPDNAEPDGDTYD